MATGFADETHASLPALGIWRFWPLRLAVFFIVLVGTYVGCQLLPILIARKLPFIPESLLTVVLVLLGIAVLITVYRLLVRLTEKRSAAELSAARSVPLLAGGALLGAVLFCSVIAILIADRVASIRGAADYGAVVTMAAAALLAGVGEEIAFRGGVYRLLEEGFGTTIAVILSGALFGLLHWANPGATAMSALAIALTAGVLLAAAYPLTRSLWLPIGIHFGWNFTEGGIFGASVSGGKSHGILATAFSGPDLLTGGKFGPEGSIVTIGVCLAAAIVMLVLAARHGQWKPMGIRLATA
ncbi:MAG: lysostaphin resistance A-like protein [Rhizomicrobium sp.]